MSMKIKSKEIEISCKKRMNTMKMISMKRIMKMSYKIINELILK